MAEVLNSRAYWEKRFAENEWKQCAGRQQTMYFAQLFKKHIPNWVIEYINKNEMSMVDLGCAEGDAVNLLSPLFHNPLSGVDFSESAIKEACNLYPGFQFHIGDICDLKQKWDVSLIINVLEHFQNPFFVLGKIANSTNHMVIAMVPFEESPVWKEHEVVFTYENIPLAVNDFELIYYNNIMDYDNETTLYRGQQMLLIYSKDRALSRSVTIAKSSNVIRRWISSQDYITFKKDYFTTKAALSNELEVSRNLGAMNTELNNKLQVVEQSVQLLTNENQKLQADGEQLSIKLKQIHYDKEQLTLDNNVLTVSFQKASTQVEQLQEGLSERNTQIERLQGELQQCSNRMKQLTEDLQEQSAQMELLSMDFREQSCQVEQLKDDLLDRSKQVERLEKVLVEEKDRYNNLYIYSSKRDEQLTSIINSRSYIFFNRWLKKPMQLTYRIMRKAYRIFKAAVTCDFKKCAQEIGSPLHKIFGRMKGILTQHKIFKEIAQNIKGKRVIILPPTLDWHMPLFQRPQQLALAYARKVGTTVIYMTKNIQYDCIPVAERVSENVWVVNELVLDKFSKTLKNASATLLSLSWTPNKFYCDKIQPDKLIYEYIDELEIFHMYGPEMEQDHQNLMKSADVTVCTASKLYKQALGKAKHPIISTNAGDYEFFAKTSNYEVNPWIKGIIGNYECVLGYYGAVAKWFDYELVKKVATMHPKWLWIIVGIDYDESLKNSGFDKITNIIYIPPQPYKDLPSFLTAFDVATIPFLINEITLSTSPVKLFEYMAGGKPIVTSHMPECTKYKSVMLYSNAEEFCQHVEQILAMKKDDPYWELLKCEALENTWDKRTDEILKAVEI